VNPHLVQSRLWIRQKNQTLDEAIHVYLSIGDSTEAGISPEVLHLVQIKAPRDKAPQR